MPLSSLAVGVHRWAATTNTAALALHLSLLVDASIAEEPGAKGPHGVICAGGPGKRRVYRDYVPW